MTRHAYAEEIRKSKSTKKSTGDAADCVTSDGNKAAKRTSGKLCYLTKLHIPFQVRFFSSGKDFGEA